MKKKIVVLSGAGMSQESGISTFRDADGLWENHDITEVASIDGWRKNPGLVLNFYNQRRRQLHEVTPNEAHNIIADLEVDFDVSIVTQNIDNLHEASGSSQVIHLHGELFKACSEKNKALIMDWKSDINLGDTALDGNQIRPFIVWFGEEVPEMHNAAQVIAQADILIVIGTSLQVYPAAGLIHDARRDAKKYIIDPNCNRYAVPGNFEKIPMKAIDGMKYLRTKL
jgi:NAD-dependent deacetylase